MVPSASQFLPVLVHSTVMLTVAAAVAQVATWKLRPASVRMCRVLWGLVLVQGILLARLPVRIPWYEATSVRRPHVAAPQVVTTARVADTVLDRRAPSVQPHLTARKRLGWRATVAILWAGGLAVVLTFSFGAYLKLLRASGRAHRATGEWARDWEQVCTELAVDGPIELRVHDSLGPLLVRAPGGYRVLVPVGLWTRLSPNQRCAVLRHEVAHYLGGDVWMSLVVRLLVLPHWFNPLAWWAVSRFEECSEWACDGIAAGPGHAGVPDYARALLLADESPADWGLCQACLCTPPLSRRIRRLLVSGQQEDSLMKTGITLSLPLFLAVFGLLRIELVAKEALPVIDLSAGPVTVERVKAKHTELEHRLDGLKTLVQSLEPELEAFLHDLEMQVAELKTLEQNPDNLSEEIHRRASLARLGDASSQLDALDRAETLGDEGALLIGAIGRDSAHEVVRREAIDKALQLGAAGYRIVAMMFEKLPPSDRAYLVESIGRKGDTDHLMPLIAVGKDADPALMKKIIAVTPDIPRGLELFAAIARKADESLTDDLVAAATRFEGEDGLMLLFAAAKSSAVHHRLAALKAASGRGKEGLVVLAAAFDCPSPEVRGELVRVARDTGGDVAQFIIDHALADENPGLRQAAEVALAQQQ